MSSKLITKAAGKNDSITLKIEKEFSITNVEAIKFELDEIIRTNKVIHLEMKNIEAFDLSAIQVLHALKEKLGKDFTYKISMKDEIKTILNHSGFEKYIN